MKIEKLKLSEIHQSPYNPRIPLSPGDEEYEHLKASIQTYGLVEPLVVNIFNMACVGGNQRFTVLKDLGWEEAECVIVDIKDPLQEESLCIAMNKIRGEWNMEKLAELLSDESVSALETGFDEGEIDLSQYLGDPDEDPEYDEDLEMPDLDELREELEEQYTDAEEGVEETNGICYFATFRWKIPVETYKALLASIRAAGYFDKQEIVAEIIRRIKRD